MNWAYRWTIRETQYKNNAGWAFTGSMCVCHLSLLHSTNLLIMGALLLVHTIWLSLWYLHLAPVLAMPAELDPRYVFLQTRGSSFEWTAWGDSYASGVGAGNYVNGRRCLRYDGAYPYQIYSDKDGTLHNDGGKFNNVVCSGAEAHDILDYQFYDSDMINKPNGQYTPRPSAGKPSMGTLTMGGDDIDFPGILNNCIAEGFP